MRLLVCTCVMTVSSHVVSAHAQAMPTRQDITRVTMQIAISTPTQLGASPEDQLAMQAESRRKLYVVIENECRVLAEVFQADCRVAQVATSTMLGPRGSQQPEVFTLNGNGTFELLPRK